MAGAFVWARHRTDLPTEEIASRVIGTEGGVLAGSLDGLGEDDAYRLDFVGDGGRYFEGVVQVNGLPDSFAATVANMNHSSLRFEIEKMGADREVWLWLSTYGMDDAVVKDLEKKWKSGLERVLG